MLNENQAGTSGNRNIVLWTNDISRASELFNSSEQFELIGIYDEPDLYETCYESRNETPIIYSIRISKYMSIEEVMQRDIHGEANLPFFLIPEISGVDVQRLISSYKETTGE